MVDLAQQEAPCITDSRLCTAVSHPGLFFLQVLDDSTCKATRQLVDEKAAEWAERGIKCEVVRRTNRQGYKAGALKDVSDPQIPHTTAICTSVASTGTSHLECYWCLAEDLSR